MRTTIDIDTPVLNEIKALQKKDGRALGRLVSELLADALASRKVSRTSPAFRWTSRNMRPLVDIADKDAVYAALDSDRE